MKTVIKYTLSIAFVLVANSAFAWYKTGHEVISILATERLTPNTQKQVKKILKGDIRSNSLWLDQIKEKNPDSETKYWHSTMIDKNGCSTTDSERDGVVQLERNIEILRNRAKYDKSVVADALRTVIHIAADLHCVSNIRFADIPHSRNFNFYRTKGNTMDKAKCSKMTWHQIWSKWYFDIHAAFSPEMFAQEIRLCQGDQFEKYAAGTPREWVEEMGREARPLIEYIRPEEILDNATSYNWELIHERCLAKASVRLAMLLNDIFSE